MIVRYINLRRRRNAESNCHQSAISRVFWRRSRHVLRRNARLPIPRHWSRMRAGTATCRPIAEHKTLLVFYHVNFAAFSGDGLVLCHSTPHWPASQLRQFVPDAQDHSSCHSACHCSHFMTSTAVIIFICSAGATDDYQAIPQDLIYLFTCHFKHTTTPYLW